MVPNPQGHCDPTLQCHRKLNVSCRTLLAIAVGHKCMCRPRNALVTPGDTLPMTDCVLHKSRPSRHTGCHQSRTPWTFLFMRSVSL